ncbi:MAG: nucleotide exchange factor GrpE [Elusimicrobia bacterium]|nr:nucleotide exchange factor GrpE [Elusimicrobiota bacterium]
MSDEPNATAAAQPAAPSEADKAADYYGQLLRLKAEFENYRKRMDRDKPEWVKLGAAGIIAKLLPLYDLLRHAHQDVQSGYADTPLSKGMDAIFKEFEKLFKEEGVSAVDPLGQPFDPHYQEAFGFVDKPGFAEDAVADVLQIGFLLGDKVLRTAKVRLQKREQKTDASDEKQ